MIAVGEQLAMQIQHRLHQSSFPTYMAMATFSNSWLYALWPSGCW